MTIATTATAAEVQISESEKQIIEVISAIGYDDEAHFIKDFTRSNTKSVADLVSETWADCMCFAECHKMLSSIPCPMPRSAVLRNMGLGQISYLSRFGPNAYKTSLELFQLNRSLENTDDTEVPKIGSRCAEKPQPLPQHAVAYLGSELAALADEFNRWSHEFCAFVEGIAACDGQWESLRREVKGALLCLHQLQITFVHSEALWLKKIEEALSED